nr:MAG TPA: hypothetical protein [Caudoviricetes sp.]
MLSVVVIVLSSLSLAGWLAPSLPMSQSCSSGCCESTSTAVTYYTKLCGLGVLTDAGRVWYTRAHVPIYGKGAFNYS